MHKGSVRGIDKPLSSVGQACTAKPLGSGSGAAN
jgi:hypothetical protein